MKSLRISILVLAGATAALAQQWEIGGGAGASFLPGVGVSNPAGSASTGFKPGVAASGYFGQNLYSHISGEIHYDFVMDAMRLSSGGSDASFSAVSHMIHYDILWHTNRHGSRKEYYVVAGGGMRIFRGTGTEAAYQPLSQFAYFTKTQTVKPMASIGGGVQYKIGPRLFLRAEVRDYISPFPQELIAPAPGSKIGSILHDFVPSVSISYDLAKDER